MKPLGLFVSVLGLLALSPPSVSALDASVEDLSVNEALYEYEDYSDDFDGGVVATPNPSSSDGFTAGVLIFNLVGGCLNLFVMWMLSAKHDEGYWLKVVMGSCAAHLASRIHGLNIHWHFGRGGCQMAIGLESATLYLTVAVLMMLCMGSARSQVQVHPWVDYLLERRGWSLLMLSGVCMWMSLPYTWLANIDEYDDGYYCKAFIEEAGLRSAPSETLYLMCSRVFQALVTVVIPGVYLFRNRTALKDGRDSLYAMMLACLAAFYLPNEAVMLLHTTKHPERREAHYVPYQHAYWYVKCVLIFYTPMFTYSCPTLTMLMGTTFFDRARSLTARINLFRLGAHERPRGLGVAAAANSTDGVL
ncbi:membrane protein ORF16 [Cyprinid herpesvirus 3]|uniref:ORF16L n=1 Tax=Cyprinid herpesvirus 3 TaxID=180230 RepID=A0A060IK13_CYHV3|nr:ORF16L [Cyprinid herpesvirus 3]AVL27951.1 membrane protein ORF16 [Cyprinid herpesvirus 3]